MKFEIKHKDENSRARSGIIETQHGTVKTPAFMPVGTQATVKGIDPKEMESAGVEMIISNLNKNAEGAKRILKECLPKIAINERSCPCKDALKYAIVTRGDDIPAKVKKDLSILIDKCI